MASGVGDDGAVGTQQEQLHTPQPSPLTSGAFLHVRPREKLEEELRQDSEDLRNPYFV